MMLTPSRLRDQFWSRSRSGSRVASSAALRAALERLRASGVDLRRVVDVGACQGSWTELLREVYPSVSVLLVEPQSRHAEALRQYAAAAPATTIFAPALVGASAEDDVVFHVLDDPHGGTGSSVMRELSNVDGHVEHMSMTTLRHVIATTGFGTPELVKLDVQGFELQVLEGLGDLLASIEFVVLEAAVFHYNEGAPLIVEVLQWMADHGFALHDVAGETRLPDDTLAQLDLVFTRADHRLRRPRVIEFPRSPDQR